MCGADIYSCGMACVCSDESEAAGSSPSAHSAKYALHICMCSSCTSAVSAISQTQVRASAGRPAQESCKQREPQACTLSQTCQEPASWATGRGEEGAVCVIYIRTEARTSVSFYRRGRRARERESRHSASDGLTTAAKGERGTRTQRDRNGTMLSFGLDASQTPANEHRCTRLGTVFYFF